jgi:hypothetical protein
MATGHGRAWEKQRIMRLAYNPIEGADLERLCAFGQEQI